MDGARTPASVFDEKVVSSSLINVLLVDGIFHAKGDARYLGRVRSVYFSDSRADCVTQGAGKISHLKG